MKLVVLRMWIGTKRNMREALRIRARLHEAGLVGEVTNVPTLKGTRAIRLFGIDEEYEQARKIASATLHLAEED